MKRLSDGQVPHRLCVPQEAVFYGYELQLLFNIVLLNQLGSRSFG